MRFKVFVALLVIALITDAVLLGFGLLYPQARLFELPAALAASFEPAPTLTPAMAAPTAALAATYTPQPTSSPPPTAPPQPTATATATASPQPSPTQTATATATPMPQLLASKSFAFTPADKAVRANIRLAMAHYYGALTHVVLAPGAVFSFNATLGLRPQALPWKNVKVKPTSAPTAPAEATPAPVADPQLIQGGGLCDLASRFVMAARPMLPARAFSFVNHVKSNGIHLSGVPVRDSVSIWAIGGGRGEQDLKITNLTGGWLEFLVERDGEKITVTAQLWDSSPPGW